MVEIDIEILTDHDRRKIVENGAVVALLLCSRCQFHHVCSADVSGSEDIRDGSIAATTLVNNKITARLQNGQGTGKHIGGLLYTNIRWEFIHTGRRIGLQRLDTHGVDSESDKQVVIGERTLVDSHFRRIIERSAVPLAVPIDFHRKPVLPLIIWSVAKALVSDFATNYVHCR